MSVITGGNVIEGGGPQQYAMAGVPTNGTDEVQRVTIGGAPTAGAGSYFRLAFQGWTTAPILWHATNATLLGRIDAALEALPNIGTGGVVTADVDLNAGVGNLSITFSGTRLAKLAVPQITVAEMALTGNAPTVATSTTTPGVDASFRDARTGDKLVDSTNGVEYVNTGVPGAPTWVATSVGAVSQEMIDFVAAIPFAAIADVAGAGIAIAAANPTAVAAADAAAVAGTVEAGGVGAAAGGWDTAGHRDTTIATISEMKTTVNALVTEATELKAKAAVERTELTELKLDIETLSATVVEIKTQLNDLLAKLRTAAVLTP